MEIDSQPISFAILSNTGVLAPSNRKTHYSVDKFFLAERLEGYISKIYFDEQWYLSTYPDVATQLVGDRRLTARKHYARFGYFENRLPYEITVDEKWYRENYRDVDAAVKQKKFESAQDHFFLCGFREGRLPYAGFQLKTAEPT